jgi:hypothetical protein
MDAYREAHIFVAAIRVLTFQKGFPPSLEETCNLLGFSEESGHALCRRLEKAGILHPLEDPFSVKLTIADHLQIESLSKDEADEKSLAKEIEKFQAGKENMDQKVKSIQADLAKKKNEMFADIESKFKKEMEKFKNK